MKYIIQTARCSEGGSKWHSYKKIAILLVEDHIDVVSMISTHAKGVVAIHKLWTRLSDNGKNTTFSRQLELAKVECADLNWVGAGLIEELRDENST